LNTAYKKKVPERDRELDRWRSSCQAATSEKYQSCDTQPVSSVLLRSNTSRNTRFCMLI